ncbi:uncharacterized protein PRCAT00001633001 [Priceomyces carsonii]|uniref:uncharacterized protein n=1 Tax=Priceomyces carsonii TaxID=28549 RepID=UPI002ED9E22C|nr:unnamed protein product [Priceomyces carsonii]
MTEKTEKDSQIVSKRQEDQSLPDNGSNKKQKTEQPSDSEQLGVILKDTIPGLEPPRTDMTPQGLSSLNDGSKSGGFEVDFDNLPAELLDNAYETKGTNDERGATPSERLGSNNEFRPAYESRATVPLITTAARSEKVSAPINRMNPLVQQAHGIQGLNTSNIDRPLSSTTNTSNRDDYHTNDPSKLNDAIAAAGVDIQQEEELLLQQQISRRPDISRDQMLMMRVSKNPSFLNPYHVAIFMNKIARENGIVQNFYNDHDLLDSISASCENWIADIVTKTIALSRHRRRGQYVYTKSKKPSSVPRSELSKELRNIAAKQKELEEKRVSKRIALGLERDGADAGDGSNGKGKAGAEETLHRAANATAAMKTSNPKKKYSWMIPSAATSEDSRFNSEKDTSGKQSSIIQIRGDNGLRFREIRPSNAITTRDLLGVIEDERIGTDKAVVKGYAKLKD